METVPRCTVPVTLCGNVYDFILRPDRFHTRIPLDIWKLLNTALTPLSATDIPAKSDEDFTGCLGICNANLSILTGNLTDHSLMVSRDKTPTLGLGTLIKIRLSFNFGNGRFFIENDTPEQTQPDHRDDRPLQFTNVPNRGDPFRRNNIPSESHKTDPFEEYVDKFLDACKTGNFDQMRDRNNIGPSPKRSETCVSQDDRRMDLSARQGDYGSEFLAGRNDRRIEFPASRADRVSEFSASRADRISEFSVSRADHRSEFPVSRADRSLDFPTTRSDRRTDFPADIGTEIGNAQNMDFLGDISPEVESIHDRHVEFGRNIRSPESDRFRSPGKRFEVFDYNSKRQVVQQHNRGLQVRIQENVDIRGNNFPPQSSLQEPSSRPTVFQRLQDLRGFLKPQPSMSEGVEIEQDSVSQKSRKRGKRGGAKKNRCTFCLQWGHNSSNCTMKTGQRIPFEQQPPPTQPSHVSPSPWDAWVTDKRLKTSF